MPSSTAEIFNGVASIVHQIPADASVGEKYRVTIRETGLDQISFTIRFNCTTTASAYATVDPMDHNKCVNYILLRHDLEFSPDEGLFVPRTWDRYRVRLRALSPLGKEYLREGMGMPDHIGDDQWVPQGDHFVRGAVIKQDCRLGLLAWLTRHQQVD